MKQSEKRLLLALYILILIFTTLISRQITSNGIASEISYAQSLTDKKARLISLLTNEIDNELASVEEEAIAASRQFFTPDIDLYEKAANLQSSITSTGIELQQLTIVEAQNQIEIVMQGYSSSILGILESLQNDVPAIRYNSVNIRRIDNSTLKVVMRMSYAEL